MTHPTDLPERLVRALPVVGVALLVVACSSSSPAASPSPSPSPIAVARTPTIRILDEMANTLKVEAGPSGGSFTVACKGSGDVPSGLLKAATHVVVRRLPDRAVLFDETLPAGSRSAIVVRASGTIVLPLDSPSYGPLYLGACAT